MKEYTATAYKWKRYRFWGAEFTAPTVWEVMDKIDNWYYKLCTTNEIDEWGNNPADIDERGYSEPLLSDWVRDGYGPAECFIHEDGEATPNGGVLQIDRLTFSVEDEDGEPVFNMQELIDKERKEIEKQYNNGGGIK